MKEKEIDKNESERKDERGSITMTLKERKQAFKKSFTVGIPTVILCWIICWFFNAGYAQTEVTLASCAVASGVSCFVTPLICGLISYPITAKMFKKTIKEKKAHSEGENKSTLKTGKLEQQLIFFNWIPKNWFAYVLVFAICGSVFWGFGVPNLLNLFIPVTISAGTGSRLFVTIIGGFQIGASAQYAAYLSNIYFVEMLQEKVMGGVKPLK